jgi:hypothetical protein
MREPISVSLELRRCRALAVLLSGLHLGAASAVLLVGWPLWLRAGLVVVVAIAARRALRRHALLNAPDACVRLRLRDDGQCWWQLRTGAEHRGRLLPQWFSTPWLTVLRLERQGARVTDVVLTPCMIDTEAHRALRVLLRSRL